MNEDKEIQNLIYLIFAACIFFGGASMSVADFLRSIGVACSIAALIKLVQII